MTSNIGARKLTESAAPIGFKLSSSEMDAAMQSFEYKKEEVLKDLKAHFKPEFLNRVDNIIVFKPLTHTSIKEIVRIHVQELEARLLEKQITLDLTPTALDLLATLSTDPDYGARPVRRKVQELIEDPLAQGFLDGDFAEGDISNPQKNKAIVLKKKSTSRTFFKRNQTEKNSLKKC